MKGSVEEKIVIIIIFFVLGVYLFFFVKKFETDAKNAILTIEENRCLLNLSEFDSDIKQMKFERFKVQKDIDLNPSENLYTWDVSFSGKEYKGVGFVPGRPLYEKMVYAVFGDKFRGCGIHIIGDGDIKPPGEIKKFSCPDGRVIYFSQGVLGLYYLTYYKIEKEEPLVTHFSLATDMKDLESSLEIIRRGKCVPE